MRLLKIFTVALAVVLIASYTALWATSRGKDIAPEISCSAEEVIEAPINCTDAELLSYVTASDKQDGDLTQKLTVSRKKYFVEKNTINIVFAVCDSDNNVTTLERKLRFNDYTSPRISLKTDFIFPSNTSYNIANYISAFDVIDGDVSNKVKMISPDYSNIAGRYTVNMKVSNSMGDTTDMNIESIVIDDYNSALRIRLTEYITYVKPGTEIDYKSFISSLTNKTDAKFKTEDIVIDSSEVDTGKAGVYNAYYRLFEAKSKTDVATFTRLVVVVGEE